jgi:hypothetical protein
MAENAVVPPWYEAPMTRTCAKHPDVNSAVKSRLITALAEVPDSKPLSKSDLAALATDLLNASEITSPSVE